MMLRRRCHFIVLLAIVVVIAFLTRCYIQFYCYDSLNGREPATLFISTSDTFEQGLPFVSPRISLATSNNNKNFMYDVSGFSVASAHPSESNLQMNEKHEVPNEDEIQALRSWKKVSENILSMERSQQLYMPYNSTHLHNKDTVNKLRRQQEILIKERRRLVEQSKQIVENKIRFQQKLNNIVKDFEKGGVVEVRKKPYIGLPALNDPKQWEGLNSTHLHDHYPGIVLAADYVLGRKFIAPDDSKAAGMQGAPHSIEDMTDGQAEERFYQMITTLHVECLEIRRMGSFDDGGWDLCTIDPYVFKPGCIVYSFGINFDFTFDDAMATAFKCSVRSFDPSMTVSDYLRSANVFFYKLGIGPENTVTDKGWKLMTLKSIQARLHHTRKVIDVIKLDIEYSEWACLQQMVTDGSLNNVKQLIFEIHTPEVESIQHPSTKEDFLHMFLTLAALEDIGFRKYHYHYNPLGHYTSIRTGKTRSCCYELYYINIHFLKRPSF